MFSFLLRRVAFPNFNENKIAWIISYLKTALVTNKS